jgi:hypothetical protein
MDADLTELLGYAAAGLVLATFSARSITALRALAIASNLLFIAYAACAALMPVLVLHALLLPMNLIRLRQALAEGRCVADQPAPRPAIRSTPAVRPTARSTLASQPPSAPPAAPAGAAKTARRAAARTPGAGRSGARCSTNARSPSRRRR